MKKPILPSEIEISFHPSHFLWGWYMVFSMLVLFSVWVCLPWMWSVALSVVYLLAGLWSYRQQVATGWRLSVRKLRVDVYGEMTLINYQGQCWRVNVSPNSVVHPWCMVLSLQYPPDDHSALIASLSSDDYRALPRRLLILPDHAPRASLSALRVWLKWGLKFTP